MTGEKSGDTDPLGKVSFPEPSKGIRQSGAGLIVWIVLLAFCGLTAYAGWKLWPLAQGIHGIYKRIQHHKSLPNPVVVQDGVYWFPLGGRVFAVPEAHVVSYGRNSTDGKLSDVSLHALLPDFAGRTPENLARFKTLGWGDRIEVMVYATRLSRQDDVEWHNYYKIYIPARDRLKEKQGEDPEIISHTPRVEKIRGLDVAGDDSFYLIEGDRVKKKIYCIIKRRERQSPSCKALGVFFRDRIRFHFTFSRAYEKDWIAISDRLADWLTSFERPPDAFPSQAKQHAGA